jgi:hypothetical protein
MSGSGRNQQGGRNRNLRRRSRTNGKAKGFLCEIFSITILHLSCSSCNADADVNVDDIYKPQEIECSLNFLMTQDDTASVKEPSNPRL